MVLKGETSVSPTVLPEALVAALIGGEGDSGLSERFIDAAKALGVSESKEAFDSAPGSS